MSDRDDLTTKRAAAEAAGMRLPLRLTKSEHDYHGDWSVHEATGLHVVDGYSRNGEAPPVLAYLVAAANAAPGLAAEVERLRRVVDIAQADNEALRRRDAQSIADWAGIRAEVERLRTDLAHLTAQTGPDSCAGMAQRHAEEVARLTQERDGLREEHRCEVVNRMEASRALDACAAIMGCDPEGNDDLVEAVRLLVKERDDWKARAEAAEASDAESLRLYRAARDRADQTRRATAEEIALELERIGYHGMAKTIRAKWCGKEGK